MPLPGNPLLGCLPTLLDQLETGLIVHACSFSYIQCYLSSAHVQSRSQGRIPHQRWRLLTLAGLVDTLGHTLKDGA